MPNAGNDQLATNQLSFMDRVKTGLTLLVVPSYLVFALAQSPFTPYGRSKSWKRIIADRAVYALATNLDRKQLRALFGTTRGTYDAFVKEKNLLPVVEEIGDDARLLWIGPKHTDRVVLYFHGGALLYAALGSTPLFWYWMKTELGKRGKSVGFAMLNYTLVPDATFPTQLRQAVLAIQHVIDSGVKPENIALVGDSAGGLMIHQVLSHMLHPVDGVPQLKLETPLAGTFFMSPWTRLRDPHQKYLQATNMQGDFLTADVLDYWGSVVTEGLPDSAIPYVEANVAPRSWFKDVHKCTKRVLITAGGVEVLRDEILAYARTMEKYHKNTTTIVDENGVHIDPMVDFLVGDYSGELTANILDWLNESFSK